MPGGLRTSTSGGTGGSCTRVRIGVALRTCAIFSFALNTHAAQDGPLSPQDALATFQHDPAVRIELVANEPLVLDPIALCFDALGRMFVIENSGYPTDADPPLGKIVLLEDTDNDTVMDKRTVFAEGFDFPSGIMPWRDGLLVICAPDVLHLKDTDGDGRADAREVLLTGFSTGGSTQLRSSHPTLALDGWIYFTNGLSGGEVRRPGDPPEAAVKMGNMDLRWNPWDGRIETTTGQAQYGQAFDEYGNRFLCSNRKHIEQVMFQPGDLARNPYISQTTLTADIPDHGAAAKIFPISSNITTAYSHGGTFTAACGLVIYKGHALGTAFTGNAFVCDPTGNLVHRDILEYNGAACTARHPYGDREFLASTDNWFRPVFLAIAPDGALYLCDMYRKTIEHPVYLPPEVAAKTDFTSGRDRGRIYRIVSKDAPAQPAQPALPNRMKPLSSLASDNGWHADTVFRLVVEAEEFAEPEARGWYNAASGANRAKGLSLLSSRGRQTPEDLGSAIASEFEALQLAALRHVSLPALSTDTLRALLKSPSHQVRFRAALLAGAFPGNGEPVRRSTILKPDGLGHDLAEFTWRNQGDPWLVRAALSSASPDSRAYIESLLAHFTATESRVAPDQLRLGETVAAMAGGMSSISLAPLIMGDSTRPPDLWQLRCLAAFLASRPPGSTGLTGTPMDQLKRGGVREAVLLALKSACTALAVDDAADLSLREAATTLLGYMDFNETRAALAALVAPGAPATLQCAAIRAMATRNGAPAAALLADANTWVGLSVSARALARSVVLANQNVTTQLLHHVKNGTVSPYTFDPTTRDQMLKSSEEDIALLASAAFSQLSAADRTRTYEEQKDLLALAPDATRGRAVYAEQCAQCHVFKGEGHKVGPELSDMSLQTPDYILLHLIDPNKAVTAGFESYTVNTTGLETHVGILATQNDTAITLRQALGTEQTIPRAEIASQTTENRSLMPEELEKVLSKQQIRDLIGFLRGE